MWFERPIALLLLLGAPLVALLLWRARAFFDTQGHRALVVTAGVLAWTALALAIAAPWVDAERGRPTRCVIATGGGAATLAADWRAATPARDPFVVLAPGDRVAIGARGATAVPHAAGDPDLAAALRAAIALAPDGGDVVIAGDAGDAGRDPSGLRDELLAAGLRVHARTTPLAREGNAVLALRHPARVDIGDAFRLEAELAVAADRALRVEVRAADDGAVLGARDVDARTGSLWVAVDVSPGLREGVVALEAVLVDAGTVVSRERSAILCDGRATVHWLGSGDAALDALRTTLAPHAIDVMRADPATPLASSSTRGADVLVVDDLPADAWPTAAQSSVADAVQSDGLGLLLAGAYRNLGPGGYATSPLAAILPLDMPQREERRDPSVALVVVIDTSGSMGARIDLAKEVARLAIRRLMPHDKAGIVEFYGSKRWAAPLQPASNGIELMRALDRMQSGGGTVIFAALEESYYALLNARTRFKHILVLTDGGVESGPFEELARRIAAASIQLNTVLLGPQAQGEFLMNLAQWGGGRFYACPSRFQLPDLRFKEPQTTRLPAVREEPIAVEAHAGAESVAALREIAEARVGGLVEASARPGAESLLDGDGGALVLGAWDQGAGRVAALATELLGPMADPLRGRAWSELLADQIRSLARGRQALRPRLFVDATRGSLRVALRGMPASLAEARLVVQARTGPSSDVSLVRASVDELATEIAWPSDDAVTLDVRTSDEAAEILARGAARRPFPRDGRRHDRSAALASLARATGASLDGALPVEAPAALTRGARSTTPLLAALGIAAFLLLVIARRWPRGTSRAAGAILLAMVLAPATSAQDDPSERIAAELRTQGDLDALATAWRDGTPEQRIALARARGDLATIVALGESSTDRPTRVLRAVALEMLGRLPEAIAVLDELLAAPGLAPSERGELELRRAELLVATSPRGAAPTTPAIEAFRRAAQATDDAALRVAIGHLAGGYGLLDVALELHVPPASASATARTNAHLRRGAWFAARGDLARAREEYAAAAAVAPMDRERAFASSKVLAATTDNDGLRAFAGDVQRRLDTAHDAELEAMLDALRALGDGAAVLALFDAQAILARPALQQEIVAIAVECGLADQAVIRARRILDARPRDHRLRVALALLLTDLLRRDDARAVLMDGIAGAPHRELLALTAAAAELSDDESFRAGLARLRASPNESERVDALLLEIDALRARGRETEAAELALGARDAVSEVGNRARVAGTLESLGRADDAIAAYRALLAAQSQDGKPSEDLALRLGWLLASSKDEAARTEGQKLFRDVWLNAGSAARRAQAQEKVLDLAARDGTLADLALELEQALADPSTPQRDQKREALVQIWTRAHDTFGARDVLLQWAKDEPTREVEAWQAIARVSLETDDYRGQEKALRRLMQIDPTEELEYRQQLVLAFLERGRAADARAVIREMLGGEVAPDAVALEFAAGIFALAGRPQDAARLYRRAYAVHPDRIETLLLWANAMVAQQRGPEAIGVFLDLIAQDVPDDLFLVGVDGLLNLSAPQEALRFAERALRRRIAAAPDRVFLQRALQDVLEQLDDRAGRLAVLEETVAIAGQQRSAWLREAMEEAASEKAWPRYLEHAKALLRSGDEVPPAVFVEMGEALLAAGDLPGAERAFARARLAPDFAAIERRIATAYEKRHRLDDADRILRRALRRSPDDPEALCAVARLAEQRGARDDALRLWGTAAVILLRGESFAEAAAQPRGFQRNRRDDGPSAANAFLGVLRIARDANEVSAVRDALLARLDGREPLPRTARRTLAGRLSRLAQALDDDDARRRAREVEDELLHDKELEAPLRRELVAEALARGELARVLTLPSESFDGIAEERVRALLLDGRRDELTAAIDAQDPASLEPVLRWLVLCGEPELRDRAAARLRDAAAADQKKLGRIWQRVAPLVGAAVDENVWRDANLADALVATGTPQQKGQRLLAALRAHTGLDAETRARHARTLLGLVQEAGDANFAGNALEAAREWLPATELAPFVGIAFKKLSSPYLLASRAPLAALLPIDDAERMLRDAARPFGDEARAPLLQAVANGQLPDELARRLVASTKLDPRAMSENAWVTRLVVGREASRVVLEELGKRLLRDAADDPRRTLLELRLLDDPIARKDAAQECTADLASAEQLDWNWIQLVDGLIEATTPVERKHLRERLAEDDTPAPARRVLIAEFDRALGDHDEAADRLLEAALAQPDNLALQNRVVGLLDLLGRKDDIARLYSTWVERAATVYPYQATQLASLHLERGRPLEAIAALDRTEDDFGMTLGLRLRAAVQIEDPVVRERELRSWLQRRDALPESLGVRMIMSRVGGAIVARAQAATAAPSQSSPDGALDGDLLGSVRGAEPFLRALIRNLDPKRRIGSPDLDRGLLRTLREDGRHAESIAVATATLARDPHDAEALAVIWAALQLGEPVAPELADRAFRRRALLADRDVDVLADLCRTAHAAGRDDIVDRTLDLLLADRNTLAMARSDDTTEFLVALAAERRPAAMLALAPEGDALDVELDSLLLAHALQSDLDPALLRDRFAAIGRRLADRAGYSTSRLRLPWAGLQLRLGDEPAALSALTTEDLSVDRGDPFPGLVLAAAIPPLARWAAPEHAGAVADALVAAIDAETNLARRFLVFRVAALLAIRLEEAGRVDDAAALRKRIDGACAGVPEAHSWLRP